VLLCCSVACLALPGVGAEVALRLRPAASIKHNHPGALAQPSAPHHTHPHPHCNPAGGTIPWVPRSVSPKIGLLDQAAIALFDKFSRAAIKTGRLRIILPNGDELCYGDAAKTAAPVPKGAWGGGWGVQSGISAGVAWHGRACCGMAWLGTVAGNRTAGQGFAKQGTS